MRIFLASIVVLLLSGCASVLKSRLGPLPDFDDSKVVIVDNRTEEQKKYRRNGLYSPVQKLADSNFDPELLQHFHFRVTSLLPVNDKTYTIQINDLSIFDVFTSRMLRSHKAAIEPLAIFDVSLPESILTNHPDSPMFNADFFVGRFVGAVNGRQLSTLVVVPYKPHPMSGNVFNDPAFLSAFNEVITKLAEEITQPEYMEPVTGKTAAITL